MKKIVLLFILVIIRINVYSQENRNYTKPNNNIAFNVMGDYSLFSIQYERLVWVKPSFLITGKIGLGVNKNYCIFEPCTGEYKRNYFTIPHHLTANNGKKKHFIEYGLGGTFVKGKTIQGYYLYPIFGYRLQFLKRNKIYFRFFIEPPILVLGKTAVIPFPLGINIGATF